VEAGLPVLPAACGEVASNAALLPAQPWSPKRGLRTAASGAVLPRPVGPAHAQLLFAVLVLSYKRLTSPSSAACASCSLPSLRRLPLAHWLWFCDVRTRPHIKVLCPCGTWNIRALLNKYFIEVLRRLSLPEPSQGVLSGSMTLLAFSSSPSLNHSHSPNRR